ncbi:helix-turn-helix domain-containing protein [Micromonospora sp. NPDC005220]|uniref:MarR family transcriptional regulator n=1 Tax=Micromonospora sp. NPDC005220 TaxID=3155589 RepID=UPI0033BF860B
MTQVKPDPALPTIYAVRRHGTFLATRALAKTALHELEDTLPTATADGTVAIDFTGVVAMSISFADEFLGRYYGMLSTSLDAPPAVVLLTGLNDDNFESMTVCLQRRELVAAMANAEGVSLVGAPAVLNETYHAAGDLGRFTAARLADRLGISAPNANNRLKRLVAARALIRHRGVADRGGKEFSYEIPAPPAAMPSAA